MITKLKIFERSEHFNLHGDDDYTIVKVFRDEGHNYSYCDGILYELSHGGKDFVAYIEEVEHTDENMFYQDQIERYVEYFQDGGVMQTFPVATSQVGGAYTLEEMMDFLDEPDNFDLTYEILKSNMNGETTTTSKKLFDVWMDIGFYDLINDYEDHGFIDNFTKKGYTSPLQDIRNVKDLDGYCNDSVQSYDEELYLGYVAILEYWDENQEYSLLDFNHRFAALKEMGKSRVMVEVM